MCVVITDTGMDEVVPASDADGARLALQSGSMIIAGVIVAALVVITVIVDLTCFCVNKTGTLPFLLLVLFVVVAVVAVVAGYRAT